jgi:hypothetical protein
MGGQGETGTTPDAEHLQMIVPFDAWVKAEPDNWSRSISRFGIGFGLSQYIVDGSGAGLWLEGALALEPDKFR